MQDRVPLYPGRVKLTPVSGQANTYDLVRADQPTQTGTPLNKASLLKDATAAMLGLNADAVPDDVLNLLGRFHSGLGNEYVWSKGRTAGSETTVIGYVNSPNENAYPPAESDGFVYNLIGRLGEKVRIFSGSYVGTGATTGPKTLTFEFKPAIWGFLGYKQEDGDFSFMAADGDLQILPWGVDAKKAYVNINTNSWWKNITYNGNTVSFYNSKGGPANDSAGITFYYFAIG